MLNAIRRKTFVQPGGRIEVTAPELPEGAAAEIIVLLSDDAQPSLPPLASFFGAARGVYGSPEEIDEYISQLRDEWD